MDISPENLSAPGGTLGLKPIYLVAGPETLRVIEACDGVRRLARENGCAEREVFEVAGAAARETKSDSARESVWSQIEGSINAPSLFSPKRLIEIRLPGGRPGTEGAKFLEAMASAPPDGVVVLVICEEWSRKHGGKWSQAIERNGVVSIAWAVRPHELSAWLDRRARARGLALQPDALQLIADRVDGNLLAAAQEIEKLGMLTKGEPATLDAAALRSLIADSSRFDVFRLIDATWNGHAAQASRMLTGLRLEGAAVPALMGMVINELKMTLTLAERAASGSLSQAMRSLHVWESKQAIYQRAVGRHPVPRWNRFLFEAGRVDRASKGREAGDAWLHLERLLLAIASPQAMTLLSAGKP